MENNPQEINTFLGSGIPVNIGTKYSAPTPTSAVSPLAAFVSEAPAPPQAAVPELSPEFEKCTQLTCAAGHKWPASLKLGKCGGCDTQVIVVEFANCPECNEEYTQIDLRVEITSTSLGIPAICRGEAGSTISNLVTLEKPPYEPEPPKPFYLGAPATQAQEASA